MIRIYRDTMNLLEIMLALVVVVIGFIPMIGVFDVFNKSTTNQKDIEMATKLAIEKLDEYKSKRFAELIEIAQTKRVEAGAVATQKSPTGIKYTHDSYARFKRDVDLIRDFNGDGNIIKIEVYVYWHNKLWRTADNRFIMLSTLVARKEF